MRKTIIYFICVYIITIIFSFYFALLSDAFSEEIEVSFDNKNSITSVYKMGIKSGLQELKVRNNKYILKKGLATAIIVNSKTKPHDVSVIIGGSEVNIYEIKKTIDSHYSLKLERNSNILFNKINIFFLKILNFDYFKFILTIVVLTLLYFSVCVINLYRLKSIKSFIVLFFAVSFVLSSIASVLLEHNIQESISIINIYLLILISLSGVDSRDRRK
ncbi:MAG: hypothetical protein ACOCUI_01820 [bacterium]